MTLLERLVSLLPGADVRLVQKKTQIAGQIYHMLTQRNWKQRDLAQLTGLKESYVSRVLAGDVNLTLESITKMEAAFDEDVIAVPLYYFPETGIDFSGFEFIVPETIASNIIQPILMGGMIMMHDDNVAKTELQQPEQKEYSYATAA
jgi:transcriptional regulator with XRE-family HTH domain